MEKELGPLRKIIHCDCDCFYAAVEMRDDPSLANVPIAVGGAAERRGVVATCNYQARDYGIHSAMPTARALRLCPSLVVMPPNFTKYRAISQQIKDIFHIFTDLVEPLSLDEAFLDVSEVRDYSGSATLIAEEIRRRVKAEVGITISAGVAPNKFLAKIASDWNKPDGLFVIRPHEVNAFVEKLPVGKLFGVGKVTEKKLNDLGISSCGELRAVSAMELSERFGVMGQRLYELCRGEDSRQVRTDRQRKSLSVETTFVKDLPDDRACVLALEPLFEKLSERYSKLNGNKQDKNTLDRNKLDKNTLENGDLDKTDLDKTRLSRRQFLKMRFDDFTVTTIERRFDGGLNLNNFQGLCEEAWQRKCQPVRLLGIGVRFPEGTEDDGQYLLFD